MLGVGRESFTHEIKELSNLYHPDIIFLMESKVNPKTAYIIINRFNNLYPFHFKAPFVGLTGGLWVLWKNSPQFHLDILLHQDRFVHCLIKDLILKLNG